MSELDSECKIWKYFENSVESLQGKKNCKRHHFCLVFLKEEKWKNRFGLSIQQGAPQRKLFGRFFWTPFFMQPNLGFGDLCLEPTGDRCQSNHCTTLHPLVSLKKVQKIVTFTLKKLELNWKGKIVDSNKNCGNWNCVLQRYIKHWFAVQAPTPAGTSSRSCLSAIGKKDVDVVHNGVHSCPASDQKHSPPSGRTYCDFYTTAVAGRPA